jgi:pSer/pThr/pTyr-binding forkhead associated (FHA) protein
MKRPPVMVMQFVHMSGPMKGSMQEFPDGIVSIGRHPSCHLNYPPEITSVSRNHADITRTGDRFKLSDRSTNGTFVNGKQVTEAFLQNGDIIEFSQGGPKVSFLTEMREAPAVPEKLFPSQFPAKTPEDPQPLNKKKLIQPVPEKPEPKPALKTGRTLIIQYGPTIHTFNELPVTIGKNPACELVIDKPSLFDMHAQLYFNQDQFWIKDLTGHKCVQLNLRPVGIEAPVNINDEIALTYQGPAFRHVGEGRLVEVAEPQVGKAARPAERDADEVEQPGGLISRFKKFIDDKLK